LVVGILCHRMFLGDSAPTAVVRVAYGGWAWCGAVARR
jgi:hypothetical protein